MDFAAIPIDPHAFLRRVRPWVECESPSWDAAAVSRMAGLAAARLREMGAQVRTIQGQREHGDCVLANFAPDSAARGILVLGHLDTVHASGSLASLTPWREADGRCYGPGLFDMKGGICLALEAFAQLRAGGVATPLPVRFLLTSDEESGSPGTRGLIEQVARDVAKLVLVPEGAQPNGRLVSGRYPSARFRLWTRGHPSHALLEPEKGRSAIASLARVLLEIERLSTAECPCTVTYLSAGRTVATVPVEGYAEMVCTARTESEIAATMAALRALGAQLSLEATVKSSRPTWTPSAADGLLRDHALRLGRRLGLDLAHEMAFGGSDGNITGAMGIPTLDCLGLVGADAHQSTENIEIGSIAPRGRLLAGLLATLD